MPTKLKLLVVLSSVLLTMCTFYDPKGAVVSSNGLSCRSHTSVGSVEGEGENNRFYVFRRVAECAYQCPDGKFKTVEINGKFSDSSSLYSAPKEQLDLQYCGTTLQLTTTPTQSPVTAPPTSTVVPTVSPAGQVSSSATIGPSPTVPAPLLRGDVTMCDLAVDLINFRMLEPVPDLTGKALEVQIADQQSLCKVNPVNPSLLTCTIPPGVTFPARVVVGLDGVVVNDFSYSGLGCAKISTPFPTATP